jgi:cellulose synthase/poly-beta-1,6-N-acetylglucosamine synthase-like glycosyltransferase
LKVTVIVPAYNEADRIGAVLGAAIACKEVNEVLVVDDGSKDDTVAAANEYHVNVLALSHNIGKGGAMWSGLMATDADVIVFIDADLLGLRPNHLAALIKPMREDKTLMMTAGRFTGGRAATNMSQMIMPSINSQRAIRKSLLSKVPDFSKSKFGVETIINDYVKKNEVKTKEVKLIGVTQVMKEEKDGLVKGASSRAKMYGDIIKSKSRNKKRK